MNQYRSRSWGARLIAPVAFFAAVTILVLVVQSSFDGLNGDEQTAQEVTPAGASAGAPVDEDTSAALETEELTETEGTGSTAKEFYRVQSGDTLESIAARFDTTVIALLELNPDIDPLTLRTGSRIRVS